MTDLRESHKEFILQNYGKDLGFKYLTAKE